jgi:tripartite ATP-independent transporter DctM subunit
MATGIVGAAVTVLGIMAAPIMMKSGYSPLLSAGAIAAGGTLGVLVPPSVMLIVMGPVLGVSVAKLYAAAFGPGFLLAGLYIVYALVRSYLNPKIGPAVPKEERAESFAVLIRAFATGVLPLALLIACTLGSILGGLATPTEAASVGATGAMVLGFVYRRLTFRGIKQAALSTLATSSMVLFLAVASNVFGAVFARLGTATAVTNFLLGLPLPPFAMLIIVMALIFVLGWPFEWPAIVLVFLPIFYPVIAALKYDPVWFGTLIAVNLQTAYLSPPVAMSAYYLKSVVPQWELSTIYKGMGQFMVIQIIALILVILFPAIALWFPEYLFGN